MTQWIQRARGASEAVQRLVDVLAEELGRSVVLDDPLIRMVCTSRHFGDEDPVRVRTLLQGTADAEPVRHVLAQGVTRWSVPGYTEARPDLGLLPRYCVPVRERGHLLGVLMVVSADASLSAAEREAIDATGRAVAAQMYAERLASDADDERLRALVRDLVGREAAARGTALRTLLDDGLLPDGATVVTRVAVSGPWDATGRVAVALRGALEGCVRTRSAHGVPAVERDRAVLVQSFHEEPGEGELAEQARRIAGALAPYLDPSAGAVVGVGGVQPRLADARLSDEQARVAVRAARRLPHLDGIGVWERLGEYGVLFQLPEEALTDTLVPQPLRRLLRHPNRARLVETLDCYLENAGSVPRTSDQLRIHRTSLYYRLRQIQDVTGLDLDRGSDRLLLHLGLRLTGVLPETGAVAAQPAS